MSKTDTAAPAGSTPKRSPARIALAQRIVARETAQKVIADRQADARRLTLIGEAATALAAQLAGAKARDAAILAEHVVSGATGGLPKLADDTRASLIERLAEAEAQAEAAVPALAIVEGKITDAFAGFNRSAAAVGLAVRPVVEDEVAALIEETRVAMARLKPLTDRLAGARAYAYGQGHQNAGDEKAAFLSLGNRLDEVLKELGINPHMVGHTGEGPWIAFAQRLTADADATVA